MPSRKERTRQFAEDVDAEWSEYWLTEIILKNLSPEHYLKSLYNSWLWCYITENPNTTIYIIEKYIHLPWNWSTVCFSKIQSYDFVERNADNNNLNWYSLSQNLNISLDYIERNIHLPWDFSAISKRSDMTIEFLKRHIEQNWDWIELSMISNMWDDINENAQNYDVYMALNNPRITLSFIERHIDLYSQDGYEMYINNIAAMDIVTLDFIEKYIKIFKKCSRIAVNKHITLEFMIKHQLNSWTEFSENPSVNQELVSANASIPWDWVKLSSRSNFSPKDYPEFPWVWMSYTRNPGFNFDYVPFNALRKLDWDRLSCMEVFTTEQIKTYSRFIKWDLLVSNSNMSMKTIDEIDALRIRHEGIISNPNCDIKMMKKHNLFRYTSKLAQRILLSDKITFIERRYKEHLAAYRIQQYWNLVRTDPNYLLCRKKVEKDYDSYVLYK